MSYRIIPFKKRLEIKQECFNEYIELGLSPKEAEILSLFLSRPGPKYKGPKEYRMSDQEYVETWNSAVLKLDELGVDSFVNLRLDEEGDIVFVDRD